MLPRMTLAEGREYAKRYHWTSSELLIQAADARIRELEVRVRDLETQQDRAAHGTRSDVC